MNLLYRIILVLLWLVWLSSCKSIEKSSASCSEVKTTHNSQLSTIHSQQSIANSQFSFEENGYIFVKETQIITEYDTSKPGNPIAKETKTEKESRKGTQTSANQSCHSEQSEESEGASQESHNSELRTQNSELHTSVPVVQTTTRWYVIGGIVIAVITLVTAILTRRRRKQRARKTV